MEEIISNNQPKNSNPSRISLDSIQEISNKNELYFRFSLILINIISLITGIYLLKNNDFYFNKIYNFTNYNSLYIFIITYTLGMLFALILSFIIALIAKLIFFIKNKNKQNTMNDIPNKDLINNEEIHSRISLFILNNNQNEIAIIPFTL